jgi:hypothetical protein
MDFIEDDGLNGHFTLFEMDDERFGFFSQRTHQIPISPPLIIQVRISISFRIFPIFYQMVNLNFYLKVQVQSAIYSSDIILYS